MQPIEHSTSTGPHKTAGDDIRITISPARFKITSSKPKVHNRDESPAAVRNRESGAKRVADYERRLRDNLMLVKIEISETDKEALIGAGYLHRSDIDNSSAVGRAICEAAGDATGDLNNFISKRTNIVRNGRREPGA